jgi:hypothetical protein
MRKGLGRTALVVAALLAAPAAFAQEKEPPKTEPDKAASSQIESGARQIGRGVEEAAKGVVQGTKDVGRKIGDAARQAEPQAKNAWENFKTAASDAGRSVKTFFSRLFGG